MSTANTNLMDARLFAKFYSLAITKRFANSMKKNAKHVNAKRDLDK